MDISLIGAGGGQEIHLSGESAGEEGVILGKGQVEGIYDAPTDTEWARARLQRGGTLKGVENPERDISLGFHVNGDSRLDWMEQDTILRQCFSYQLDEFNPDDTLARLVVESASGRRTLNVQMSEEPQFAPELDADLLQYGNVFYKLKVAQPMWEGPTAVTSWETATSSGSGTITVSNPTDQLMHQMWVLTPGVWTVPDPLFQGPLRRRVVADPRVIELQRVTAAMGTLVINRDPMELDMATGNGENVLGQVGGGYFFLHSIPPYTPKTELPISVTGAPSSGARAELHQPRLWSRPWGME